MQRVSAAPATGPGLTRPGGNFSTGGFIGPAAYHDGIVVGGTAVGPAPYLHGIQVPTGAILWQNQEPSATYAATAIAGNVAIVGGTDFTLRAVAVDTGNELWSHPMQGAVSGGAAITREDVFAVAGIREPGLEQAQPIQRRLPVLAARPARRRSTSGARRRHRRAPRPAPRRRSASDRRASSGSS